MIELSCKCLSVWCIWLYVLVMPRTCFRVNQHFIVAWMSRNSLLENTEIVLVSCRVRKCIPRAISDGVDISEVPRCHLLRQISSQWGSRKLLQGLVSHELTAYPSVFNLFLTQWIMVILSERCKPDNFKSHNSFKLSFTNLRDFRSNFVGCESFLESNSPDILALSETNLDYSTDSRNFFENDYLSLIQKDSVTHMHCLAVYVKEELPFAQDLSLGNSYLCFRLCLLHSLPYFFCLYWSPFSSLLHSFWFYFI